jgi:hypothetical protein
MIANLKSFALCKQMLFSGAAFQGAAAGWNTRWLPAGTGFGQRSTGGE